MTELEQIAASVAKALGLEKNEMGYWNASHCVRSDGSNVFNDYWQARCRDWLRQRGNIALCGGTQMQPEFSSDFYPYDRSTAVINLHVPDAEFSARAIHELMTKP